LLDLIRLLHNEMDKSYKMPPCFFFFFNLIYILYHIFLKKSMMIVVIRKIAEIFVKILDTYIIG
jgi:hypothetical protein